MSEQHKATYGDWKKRETEKLIMNLPSGTKCNESKWMAKWEEVWSIKKKSLPPRPGFLQYVAEDKEEKKKKKSLD